ncbi:putative nutritionally-regulated adipose and cardiac enriched protein -like [Scophthalmus maximus]|uniref:Putative nutritionally-regulated adipose and cardiac enriched protein-like n=1 Tax=Scophthalmus maximus TaxID=52904 RepID=A0A2U9CIY3_SCOMX|nr:putative nutritionally-regulated adipose and cardiac enriched protein -like [Scophthalmus maximus]
MKSLQNENETLIQQVNLLKSEQRHTGSQHKEELKRKDKQIKRGRKKRIVWTKTNWHRLTLLAKAKKKMKTTKGQWRSKFQLLEANLHQEFEKKVNPLERDRQLPMESWIMGEEEWKERDSRHEHRSAVLKQSRRMTSLNKDLATGLRKTRLATSFTTDMTSFNLNMAASHKSWWSSDGRQCWLRLGLGMLNRGREGLFELGQRLQQQGEYQAALHCFLSCLLGLTHVQSFTSLPNCLHQMSGVESTPWGGLCEAEKMFYEVALIELTALHGSTGECGDCDYMPCVCVTGPQEEATLGSGGWTTPEELSEQASQAQHLERLAQLCIMSKQPHLALEYSGKATKIHQRAFGNDHPITARSLELMATVYAEIGKTEYSDSLGQCVSALSKRLAAAESIRDSTVNCLPQSHREKHSEVRHRKDIHHQQEDTPKAKVTNGKVPTSILKRPSPNYGSDAELNHRRKGERRVRFREPETTVHAYETTPSRPHLALFTCLFLLMSFLGVAMYCTDRRRPQRVCEELEAALAVYLLHMKQLLWGCWIWLTMQ